VCHVHALREELRKPRVGRARHARAAIAEAGGDHAEVHVRHRIELQPLPVGAGGTGSGRGELIARRIDARRAHEAIEHVRNLAEQRLLLRHGSRVVDDEQQVEWARTGRLQIAANRSFGAAGGGSRGGLRAGAAGAPDGGSLVRFGRGTIVGAADAQRQHQSRGSGMRNMCHEQPCSENDRIVGRAKRPSRTVARRKETARPSQQNGETRRCSTGGYSACNIAGVKCRCYGCIARHFDLVTASVTKLIDRLEEKGFVRRVRDASDRRPAGDARPSAQRAGRASGARA
jgi:hypothetical protein